MRDDECGCNDRTHVWALCRIHKEKRKRILGRIRARRKRTGNDGVGQIVVAPGLVDAIASATAGLTYAEVAARRAIERDSLGRAQMVQLFDAIQRLRDAVAEPLRTAEEERVERSRLP